MRMDDNKREYNKKKAFEQIEWTNKNLKNEIEYSIKNSKIYNEDFKINNHIPNKNIKFELLNISSADALFHTKITDKIGLLNFASYENPGGGFLTGRIAQEESLCHESTLYNVISTFKEYYKYNKKHINNNLYLNRAIYSPKIWFNNKKYANVITCAAPNNIKENKYNLEVLTSRIAFILDIAEDNEIDTLILGAFGCGVFNQDPNIVAKIFIDECKKRNFKKIIFAIYGKKSNYTAFENALKEGYYE